MALGSVIQPILLGARFYAFIFAFAFAMGVARVSVIAPRTGATLAVLAEVPIVMAFGWMVVRRLLRQRALTLAQRASMGSTALVLILTSEAILAQLLRGQSLVDWASDVMTPLGLVGLAGQIGVSLMPLCVTPAFDDLD